LTWASQGARGPLRAFSGPERLFESSDRPGVVLGVQIQTRVLKYVGPVEKWTTREKQGEKASLNATLTIEDPQRF